MMLVLPWSVIIYLALVTARIGVTYSSNFTGTNRSWTYGPFDNDSLIWINGWKFPPRLPLVWNTNINPCKSRGNLPVHITEFDHSSHAQNVKNNTLYNFIRPCDKSEWVQCVQHPTQACIVIISSFKSMKSLRKRKKLNLLLLNPTAWDGQNIDWPATTFVPPPNSIVALSSFYEGTMKPYDIQVPLIRYSWWEDGKISPKWKDDRKRIFNKTVLLSFQGSINSLYRLPWESHRSKIQDLHDPDNGVHIVIVKNRNQSFQSYTELLLASKYTFAPGGGGAHSYRFLESLFAGSIPILIDEYMVIPPFGGRLDAEILGIDWSLCLIKVKLGDLKSLPNLLRNISEDDYNHRYACCKRIVIKVFSTVYRLRETFFKILVGRIRKK